MEKCVGRGNCIDICKFEAVGVKEEGVALYLGGKFGKGIRIGGRIGIYSLEVVEDKIGEIIDYYRKNGNKIERFGDMIDRIGINKITEDLES